MDASSQLGYKPLHVAAKYGFLHSYYFSTQSKTLTLIFLYILDRVNVADFLIKSGANVNAKDNSGCTPLHSAVLSGLIV